MWLRKGSDFVEIKGSIRWFSIGGGLNELYVNDSTQPFSCFNDVEKEYLSNKIHCMLDDISSVCDCLNY